MNSQLISLFLSFFILSYILILTNFSVRGCLPLIQKDYTTHVHGLTVYVKKGFPVGQDLFLENSADFHLRFRLALL